MMPTISVDFATYPYSSYLHPSTLNRIHLHYDNHPRIKFISDCGMHWVVPIISGKEIP